MKNNLEEYIKCLLERKQKEIPFLLQVQHTSGSAKEKIIYKIWKAKELGINYVLWFGNGFDLEFIDFCKTNAETAGICFLGATDFCQKVIEGGI